MTRETKIGLLVGLAFIIVIGILLSDHMSATNEPPQAALGGAGPNVREGVTAPAGNGPPVALSNSTPPDAPSSPVPTHRDLEQPAKPPVTEVRIRPGPVVATPERGPLQAGPSTAGPAAIPTPERSTAEAPRPAPTADAPAVADAQSSHDAVTEGPKPEARNTKPAGNLRELVQNHPQDLIDVDHPGSSKPTAPSAPATGPTAPRHYVAQSGDTVTKLASRFLGTSSKANMDLIIKANPSLQAEGNPVIIGRTYVIPNVSGATGVASSAGASTSGASPASARAPATPAAEKGTVWYTVKDNDNLWKIAESQLGSGNAWTTIRDMNRDVLKGTETVRPNMRLKLPTKAAVAATVD